MRLAAICFFCHQPLTDNEPLVANETTGSGAHARCARSAKAIISAAPARPANVIDLGEVQRQDAWEQGHVTGFLRGCLAGIVASLVTLGVVFAAWGVFR